MKKGKTSLHADSVVRHLGDSVVVDNATLTLRPGETVGLPQRLGKGDPVGSAGRGPRSHRRSRDPGQTSARRGRTPGHRPPHRTVEQHADTQTELTVRDVVALGRIPHRCTWTPATAGDAEAVTEVLARTDRVDQLWHTLSGGERQCTQIAGALAQQPRELLLDEPTNHFDIQHQLDLLDLVASLSATNVIALHDLNLAVTYCDHLLVLRDGQAVAKGTRPRS